MTRQDARARAHALVLDRGDSGQAENALACYRRWCDVNKQLAEPPAAPWPVDYPGATQVLLRFLYSEHPRWSTNMVTGLIRSVVGELRRGGHDVDEDRIAHYRRRVRDELGQTRLRPVDALTKAQVVAAPARAAQAVHPLSDKAVRLRGVIAVAEALGVDPTAPGCIIPRLRLAAFEIRPDAVVITAELPAARPPAPRTCQYPGCARPVRVTSSAGPAPRYCGERDPQTSRVHTARTAYLARRVAVSPGIPAKVLRPSRHLVDAERQPQMYTALVAALHMAGTTAFPLAPPPNDEDSRPDSTRLKLDRASLLEAWARAFPMLSADSGAHRPSAAMLREQIAASTAQDRVWWLAQVDEWMWLRRRNAAYALGGIVNARRHIELERLTLGDMRATPDGGFRYEIVDKGSRIAVQRGGKARTITRSIGHLSDDHADCQAHCPACAMRDHIEVRRRSGAGDDAPLFLGLDGTVLGRDGGNNIMKGLAELVKDLDNNPDGTPRSYSTRTMRTTGATLAFRAGMSPRQIADEVTGHRTEDQAALYVRRHDPFSCELVLPLDQVTDTTHRGTTQKAAPSRAL